MKRLFVLIRDKLGDTIIAFQGLAVYRAAHPEDEITVMVHRHYLPLIQQEPGYRLIPYTSSLQASLWALGRRIFGRQYDAVVVLRGFGKKVGRIARIVPARQRIHFLSRMPDIFTDSPPPLTQDEDARQSLIAPVVRALRRVSADLPSPSALSLPMLARTRTSPENVVICPVTDEARKNIAPDDVARMLPEIRRRHPDAPVRILVRTSGEQGFEVGSPIMGAEVVAFDSIAGLLRELSKASFYYGADTGLYHVAAAMDVPSIVFFGPTQPYKVMLPGQDAWAVRLACLGQGHCDLKGCKTPVCLQNAIASWAGMSKPESRLPDGCPLRSQSDIESIVEVGSAQLTESV